MPRFQLLSAVILLANDPQQTIVRSKSNAITLPEVMILRVIHGSDAAVHSLVSVGSVERSFADERERLTARYGAETVDALFPKGTPSLPTADESLPTLEEVDAGRKAAAEAQAKARANAKSKAKSKADETNDPLAALGGK